MVLSICNYENNKITYTHNNIDLSEDEIIQTLENSKIFVLNDYYENASTFVSHKKLRYFPNEKYNLEKTTYLIWNLKKQGYVINFNNICKKLPSTIKYIKLNDRYNDEPKYLPKSITHLFFGEYFNSSVDCIVYSIEYLHFNCDFNTPIDNLPGNLKKLIFTTNSKFNQSLDNLPNFLEYIFLPTGYSNTIDNLPNFLLHIEIYFSYPHPLNNLPNSVEKIIFYYNGASEINCLGDVVKYFKSSDSRDSYVPVQQKYYNDEIANKNTIKIYNIDKIFGKLPKNLKYLDLTFSYKLNLLSDFVSYNIANKNVQIQKEIIKNSQPLDNLPENLRVLKFPSNYNLIQIDKIPQNIVKLWLSNTFDQSIDRLLNPNFGTNKPKPPTKLTHLIFGIKFNHNVNYLPDSLLYLYFGNDFNKSVDNLPKSLICVSFGNNFNNTINNLPINLKHIVLENRFSQSLNNLKHGLISIKFVHEQKTHSIYNKEKTYEYSNPINKLPSSIQKIYFPTKITAGPVFDDYKHLIEYY